MQQKAKLTDVLQSGLSVVGRSEPQGEARDSSCEMNLLQSERWQLPQSDVSISERTCKIILHFGHKGMVIWLGGSLQDFLAIIAL